MNLNIQLPVKIRQENPNDFKAIYTLNCAAFQQDNEARLVDLLRLSSAFVPGLSLVATADDRMVGHILFSRIKIANGQNEFQSLALAPMAVSPEFQKQGIGGKLIHSGLERARAMGFGSVIVLGHEHYYPRFGFVATVKWNIKPPFDVPENAFMGIELIPGGLENINGTVIYPAEFESV